MKRFRNQGGFTLIELLIVIIIIGILAAIAIPMFLNQRDKAKVASVKEGVHSIQVGVQTMATDTTNDYYPKQSDVATGTMAELTQGFFGQMSTNATIEAAETAGGYVSPLSTA